MRNTLIILAIFSLTAATPIANEMEKYCEAGFSDIYIEGFYPGRAKASEFNIDGTVDIYKVVEHDDSVPEFVEKLSKRIGMTSIEEINTDFYEKAYILRNSSGTIEVRHHIYRDERSMIIITNMEGIEEIGGFQLKFHKGDTDQLEGGCGSKYSEEEEKILGLIKLLSGYEYYIYSKDCSSRRDAPGFVHIVLLRLVDGSPVVNNWAKISYKRVDNTRYIKDLSFDTRYYVKTGKTEIISTSTAFKNARDNGACCSCSHMDTLYRAKRKGYTIGIDVQDVKLAYLEYEKLLEPIVFFEFSHGSCFVKAGKGRED